MSVFEALQHEICRRGGVKEAKFEVACRKLLKHMYRMVFKIYCVAESGRLVFDIVFSIRAKFEVELYSAESFEHIGVVRRARRR